MEKKYADCVAMVNILVLSKCCDIQFLQIGKQFPCSLIFPTMNPLHGVGGGRFEHSAPRFMYRYWPTYSTH
jgi:hypothetical protein